MSQLRILGPFTQLLPMTELSVKGPISDVDLVVMESAGIAVSNGRVLELGSYDQLCRKYKNSNAICDYEDQKLVALPGFIDAHTHIAYAGSRAGDFAKRLGGKTYLEIASEGGGIWDSVLKTRQASLTELAQNVIMRSKAALARGTTTIEVKSGYGLNLEEEVKILRAINSAAEQTDAHLIPTCLAAHMVPRDYGGGARDYVDYLINVVFPAVKAEKLSQRADIFIEEEAFDLKSSEIFLESVSQLGFELTVHADQFTTGGSHLGVAYGARSVDHLEASTDKEVELIASSDTVATALPGASLGLGCSFAPVRKLLDAGASVAIASDWNPGSAPMGDLLTQASVLATFEKITMAETLSGITFRAAKSLGLEDRGRLMGENVADVVAFPCSDFREILYHQGQLQPEKVWRAGNVVFNNDNK